MSVLEEICRRKVGEIIQAVLIAEADEFLGRVAGIAGKSASGYRDGYEEPRTTARARERNAVWIGDPAAV
jgi:hypothetical protein